MDKFEEYFRTTERYQDFLCWGSDKWIFKSVEGRYLSEEIQRLYEVWQHQQAKVEGLQKKITWLDDVAERENKRANKLQEENVFTTVLLGKVEQQKAELQKRVDAFKDHAVMLRKAAKSYAYTEREQNILLSQADDIEKILGLEQALKGEG